jgi:hypothetical protein
MYLPPGSGVYLSSRSSHQYHFLSLPFVFLHRPRRCSFLIEEVFVSILIASPRSLVSFVMAQGLVSPSVHLSFIVSTSIVALSSRSPFLHPSRSWQPHRLVIERLIYPRTPECDPTTVSLSSTLHDKKISQVQTLLPESHEACQESQLLT